MNDTSKTMPAIVLAHHLSPTAALSSLKEQYVEGRERIAASFGNHGNGIKYGQEMAKLMDGIVHAAWEYTVKPKMTLGLAAVAVGGYGRGELAPFSDIDLLCLATDNAAAEKGTDALQTFLYLLWDLGLKTGHAVRTVEEAISWGKQDITVRTSMLDSRCIAGDQALWKLYEGRFATELWGKDISAFVEAKLAERDERHRKLGDSRYFLEPNIKDGKGGLRDLHTLYWIGKYAYGVGTSQAFVGKGLLYPDEAKAFSQARKFFTTLRTHLHLIAGRPEDRLTFDMQAQIAPLMGYVDTAHLRGFERLMRDYFRLAKSVGNLTRILCAILDEQQKRRSRIQLGKWLTGKEDVDGFPLEHQRLSVPSGDWLAEKPLRLLEIFRTAHENDLEIHPKALRIIGRSLHLITPELRSDPEANRCFLDILTHPENPAKTLRAMNEAGVLGRFIPDIGHVVGQMQYDRYHIFTVDEHTLNCLRILNEIERGEHRDRLPLISRLMPMIQARHVLYLALLMHDIAKGRGGDHSVLGETMACKLARRMGFSKHDAELVGWLVRNHLLMSSVAFKRDLDDPHTITDFVRQVRSPVRLRLLLALTVADISGVGPGIWTEWKAELLRKLYSHAERAMSGEDFTELRDQKLRQVRARILQSPIPWPETERESYLAQCPDTYLAAFDASAHFHLYSLIRQMNRLALPLVVENRNAGGSITEVVLVTRDSPGLFARLAAAFTLSGTSVVQARAYTLLDGTVVDIFGIQDASGGPVTKNDRLAKLTVNLETAVEGMADMGEKLAAHTGGTFKRKAPIRIEPHLIIDGFSHPHFTIVELNGVDSPGVLYRAASVFARMGISIAAAHISTYGDMIVDVFYLTEPAGHKVTDTKRLSQLQGALLLAMG